MLSAVGLLASGLQASLSISSADDELRSAREHDITVLGRSLQVSVEIALRDKQLGDVQELMTRVQELTPEVDIALLDTKRQLRSGAGPHGVPPATLEHALATVPSLDKTSVRWLEGQGPPTLMAVLPLRGKARESLGTLVVVQVIPELDAALVDTRKAALWSVFLFVSGIAVVSLALGRLSITAPLEQLVGAMRRARLRALDERIHSQRRDELGELAREYDAMMDRLVATQSALERQQERRYELEQQLARLDKLATVGQLAATLAHEIGSPLQVLVGRANVLAEREHPPEKVRHHASRIAEQGKRITDIVEKLLNYARRRPPSRQIVDIRDAAETVVDLLEHEATRREISLRLIRSPQPTLVIADQDQLQQAILNLIRNALDASSSGGSVEVEINSTQDDRGSWIEVVVRDDGIGISSQDLEQLTEPFFTTRAHEGGTGLGLSVVKAIAVSHQGELEFSSADGETRATFRLPRHERRGEAA
ncbi:MAG TPA: HAMP domain-containing sensor histidine kinase [Enhygromyxa sp.]|nr:HAMP domain-containing sensor histidine kinase [Enhygromyxa sp.]